MTSVAHLVALLVILGACNARVAIAQIAPAKMAYVEGKVLIKRGQDGTVEEAEVGTGVFRGDTVLTKPGGRAQVNLAASGVLRLSANTTISFPREDQAVERGRVIIMKEVQTWSSIKQLARDEVFEVRTPTLVAGTSDAIRPGGPLSDYVVGMPVSDDQLHQSMNEHGMTSSWPVIRAVGSLPGTPMIGQDLMPVHARIWLPVKYTPRGFRLSESSLKKAVKDLQSANSSQIFKQSLPLKREKGQNGEASSDSPCDVYVELMTVYPSTDLAIRRFQWYREQGQARTKLELGDDAYVQNAYLGDDGTIFMEYKSQNRVSRRDVVCDVRVGMVTFRLRIESQRVEDFDPDLSGSPRFLAHDTLSREDMLHVAEDFVTQVRRYATNMGWLADDKEAKR